MSLAIAIMAAGKGTRLRSSRPKVLHSIGGKPLLLHVIHAALQIVPAHDVYVIVGHQAQQVREAAAPTGVQFVEQPEQRGTAHAIQHALSRLYDYSDVLVLSGDVPLLQSSTVAALRDLHLREHAAMTILSATVDQPFGYGRILRRTQALAGSPGATAATAQTYAEVAAIVEQKALTPQQESIHEINSGIYAFRMPQLEQHLGRIHGSDTGKGSELYLTDMAALLNEAGERVLVMPAPSAPEVLGANTIAEMMALDTLLRRQTAERHMAAGVTIYSPDTVVIDSTVLIEPDVILEPHTQLLGKTRVASGTLIRSFSVLEDMTVGRDVVVRQGCILSGSTIGDGSQLGPYAHIRPESIVESGVHVGNFVELKKTHMHPGSKANHLAYLGDADIGEQANIGAGTIVCNYDGATKHRTKIGPGAFIGSDAVLVAPLTIGEGAYVAAGSCITEDVPEGALAVARARQANKEGWAAKRRSRLAAKRGLDPA